MNIFQRRVGRGSVNADLIAAMAHMIDLPDIYCAAKLVIDKYGDEAENFAARRVEQFLDDGDLDGSAAWRRILTAIEELEKETRRLTELALV
jgi:hypothetical protein